MAKPTKYAAMICLILSFVALAGIGLGLLTKVALIPIFALLPAVIYEVYRTEGESTRISSWILLIVVIAEIVFIIFNIHWNLAEFLGYNTQSVAGYTIMLGDIKVIAPALMAVLAVVLFVQTYGVYTKWLAVIIFAVAFVIIYIMDPGIFKESMKFAIEEGFNRL